MTLSEVATGVLPGAIHSELATIFSRDYSADRVAIVMERQGWDTLRQAGSCFQAQVEGTDVTVALPISSLALREQLAMHTRNDDKKPRLVLLLPQDATLLADDVRVRLYRREARRINPWRTLSERLGVTQLDPRLANQQRWLAEALVDIWPTVEKRISVGKMLYFDNAWRALTLGWLGFGAERLSLETLFAWSLDLRSKPLGRMAGKHNVPVVLLENLDQWFNSYLGGAAVVVNAICLRNDVDKFQLAARDLLPVGLVAALLHNAGDCEIVAQPLDADRLLRARLQFERDYLNNQEFSGTANAQLAAFGSTATGYVQLLLSQNENGGGAVSGASGSEPALPASLQEVLQRAGDILNELTVSELAVYSDLLPLGYTQRLNRLAELLESVVTPLDQATNDSTTTSSTALNTQAWLEVEAAMDALRVHHFRDEPQYQRALGALRLARWLCNSQHESSTTSDLITIIREYRDNGGYVDALRNRLWMGDSNEALRSVATHLLQLAGDRRETANQNFGLELAPLAGGDNWPAGSNDVVYIENAVEQLVAPVASQHPVLLLVMDGMSQADWRELSLKRLDGRWIEYQQLDDASNATTTHSTCLIAALPSVTRVSRHALFSGKLEAGGGDDESRHFARHPSMRGVTTTRTPAILFHQGDLRSPGEAGLSTEVRDAITDATQRVVAVVVNVIDDQLSSNAQLSSHWSLDDLPEVQQLLDAAREGDRLVILTSDHGHVRGHATQRSDTADAASAERYKPGTSSPTNGEVKLTGRRVVQPDNCVVVPWTETLRYAKPRKGYHGGVSLQEMVIPFAVYGSPAKTPQITGWHEAPSQLPDWWHSPIEIDAGDADEKPDRSDQAIAAEPTALGRKTRRGDDRTEDLFGDLVVVSDTPKTDVEKAGEEVATTGADAEVNRADVTVASWLAGLLESPVYATQRKRNHRRALDEATLIALLQCLDERGYQVMENELAQAIGKPRARLGGIVAGARRLLNVDGYDILSFDAPSRTLRLNHKQLLLQFGLPD